VKGVYTLVKHTMGSLSRDVQGVVAGYLGARDHCVLIEECGWSERCVVSSAKYVEKHLREYTPEIVKWVLENMGGRVDPGAEDNWAIKLASRNGHAEVVRLLLADPRVDPSAEDNWAIKLASYHGHVEVVRMLLVDPRVDPSAEDNWAIQMALRCGHTEVAEVLKEAMAKK